MAIYGWQGLTFFQKDGRRVDSFIPIYGLFEFSRGMIWFGTGFVLNGIWTIKRQSNEYELIDVEETLTQNAEN